MAYPRLKPLEPPYSQELSEHFTKMMPPGIDPIKLFRTLGHNPRILNKIRHGNLLDRGSITRREREIIILRTCARCGAEYEWGVHVAFFAERFGLGREQVRSTFQSKPTTDLWEEGDILLIALVDELHDFSQISDDLWAKLEASWKPDQLVEMIVLTGFYHTVSFVINGLKIDLEEMAPTFADYA